MGEENDEEGVPGGLRGRKSRLGGAADAPRQTVKLSWFRDARGHRPCLAAPISTSMAFRWNLNPVAHTIPTPLANSRRFAHAAWPSDLLRIKNFSIKKSETRGVNQIFGGHATRSRPSKKQKTFWIPAKAEPFKPAGSNRFLLI